MERILSYWKDQRGLSTVEYALLLAMIAAVAVTTWSALGSKVNSTVGAVGASLPFSSHVGGPS